MAKKDQRASWEHERYKGHKKNDAARVPEVNSVGKEKWNEAKLSNSSIMVEAAFFGSFY